ncbi:uncharacterized protein JCM15063_001700 [Sporobolomyces koalae]|uniref:uncharacterized protein n=1 Tax=Sporobolomyces koalae TaxID=500713 RepID=UPI00316E5E31
MEVNIEGGLPLKHFTRALTCLTRFGDELDFLVTRTKTSISTVNSSRTAFAVVHLYPRFFQHYALLDDLAHFKFSVNGKALLSPLRPRSANTIESCSIVVGSEDPNMPLEPGVDAGECRIVIRMHCQHGVVKTHRLTYSNPNVNAWARFDKSDCTSTWKASSKILKEWTDHFHLRTGNHALTDEITFYCSQLACRLKSFIDTASEQSLSENEIMSTRPLTTELSVATEDFDLWDLSDSQVITFALKEFKAIITLSDSLALPITAHFTKGGRPLMIEIEGDHLEAKYVIATTDYDSGSVTPSGGNHVASNGGIKREPSESVPRRDSVRDDTDRNQRLFNPATPSPAPPRLGTLQQQSAPTGPRRDNHEDEEDDEDGFGWGGFENADAAFAEIDHLSQIALSQPSRTPASQTLQQTLAQESRNENARENVNVLVRDTSEAQPSDRNPTGRFSRFEEDEEFGASPGPEPEPGTGESVLGPTQGFPGTYEDEERPRKKSKWNILDDE